MSDEKIVSIMRECFGAMEKGDVEKQLSFWAEDGVWITTSGTFRGKEQVKRYSTWMADTIKDMKITEMGNGIIAQGDKAFVEHNIAGTFEGKRVEVLAMCAWEFRNGKIQRMSTVMDRLLMAKQGAKGWLPKWIVNTVVKQAEKGLH
jgi:ketosteroid isomerase-like protein